MEPDAHRYRDTVKEPEQTESAIYVQELPLTCSIATVKNPDVMNIELLLPVDLSERLGRRKMKNSLAPADFLSKGKKESQGEKYEENISLGIQRKDTVTSSVV